MDINLLISIISIIIAFLSVAILSLTMLINKSSNKKIIFNEIVKQERELRIKLNEYREEIQLRRENSVISMEIELDYDGLLFNYYEYLAICLIKRLIDEKMAKLYFAESVKAVKELFEKSVLFEEGYAKRKDYLGIQGLFKRWNI